MKLKTITLDLLRGTVCAACTVLFAAAAFVGSNTLITVFAAAATMYLCIPLLRTPDKASLKRRSLTSLFMFLPLIGICCLLRADRFLTGICSLDFVNLCMLLVFYLPGACLLRAAASIYAEKQKTHPVIPIILLYLIYAVRLTDSFYWFFAKRIPEDLHYFSGETRTLYFEVCVLAVFHLILIFVLNRSIRNGSPHPKLMKVFSALLCAYTVFAAAASLEELRIYILAGGMTPLRQNAVWIMLLTGGAFLLLFVYQLAAKHSGKPGSVTPELVEEPM